MAKIAPELQLTEPEIDQLLSTESRCRIATVGPGDALNLTPMTFGWAGGQVYLFARGQKVANLRHQATATVLIDVGEQWRELQGVMLQGQARVLEDQAAELADPHLAQAQLNLGKKHGLGKAGTVEPYRATAAGNSRRWVVFVPDKIISWDNQKLP